jgi:hypothetical protein
MSQGLDKIDELSIAEGYLKDAAIELFDTMLTTIVLLEILRWVVI